MLEPCLLAKSKILLSKRLVNPHGRLSHHRKSIIGAMLGSNLELTRNMVLHKLSEERVVGVTHQIIESDSGPDEYALHACDALYLTKHIRILGVVHLQIFTRRRRKALSVRTNAYLLLFVARRVSEIRGRTAHVVNISLEIRSCSNTARLCQDALLAPGAHLSALVECDSAEIARAKASTVVSYGEFHLRDSGHAALALVIGMIISRVWQGIDLVQLLSLQRRHRRILHQHLVTVILYHRAASNRIGVSVLHRKRLGISRLIGLKLVVISDLDRIKMHRLATAAKIYATAYVAYLPDGHTLIQKARHTSDYILAHTVGKQIGSGVHEYTAAHSVIPIIVVGKSTERCLQSTNNDRHVTVSLSYPIAVNYDRPIGTSPHFSSGAVIIVISSFLRNGVMCHHRINVSGGNEEAESWSAKPLKVLAGLKIRLRKHCHSEAFVLQHTSNYRSTKGRVIHVGISRHVYKVNLRPAEGAHVLGCHGEKISSVTHIKARSCPAPPRSAHRTAYCGAERDPHRSRNHR